MLGSDELIDELGIHVGEKNMQSSEWFKSRIKTMVVRWHEWCGWKEEKSIEKGICTLEDSRVNEHGDSLESISLETSLCPLRSGILAKFRSNNIEGLDENLSENLRLTITHPQSTKSLNSVPNYASEP